MKRIIVFTSVVFLLLTQLLFSQPLSVEDIIRDASPAVVKIVVYDITGSEVGQGSGFFIGRGQIVTNAHVVEDAYSAEVHSSLNVYEHLTIIKRDDEVDLALLGVNDLGEPSLMLADKVDLRPGQRIIAIGNPLGLEHTVSDGLISAIRGTPGKEQLIQISAPISPGSSGGPLLNMEGEVIGVTSSGMKDGQNLNFAVGIATINQFMHKPENPEHLKKAKTRVFWRVILKWVINAIVLLIALFFSGNGGGFLLVIVIGIIVLIFYGLAQLWKFIVGLFQTNKKPNSFFVDESRYKIAPKENDLDGFGDDKS